jgi:hypothetical protein
VEGRYRSNINPKSVLGTLRAYEARFDLPHLYYLATPALAARQVERWAFYFAGEMVEAVNDIRRGPLLN